MNELIHSQKNMLGISDFLQNASQYTKETFPDLDMDKLLTSAISGNLSTNFWMTSVLNIARKRSETGSATYGNRFDDCHHS